MSPLWHDGPLATLKMEPDRPVAWSVAVRTPSGIRASAEDYRDAATARDGAARLARRLLARALVARVAECDTESVAIVRDTLGAPLVASPRGWHISLSGRGDHVLIGVARMAIGVDREPLGRGDILWDMLAPAEAGVIRAMPDAERPAAWLRRWTMKEAHAKLVGEPRRIRPEAVETRIADAAQGTVLFEGCSAVWTRTTAGAIETIAMWREGSDTATDLS